MSVTDLTKIETLVKGTVMIDAKKNFERSGYLFMSTAWVQSVMVDLTLLKIIRMKLNTLKRTLHFQNSWVKRGRGAGKTTLVLSKRIFSWLLKILSLKMKRKSSITFTF